MLRRESIEGLRWGVRARHLTAAAVAAASFAGLPVALATPAHADTATLTPAQLAADGGSLASITNLIGAQELWKNGFTGQGVDVAVIDTGVTPVPGLAGKVIDGPDLSLDSQDPDLANLDAFGHGTHMASIIAGSDLPAGLAKSAKKCDTCVNESPYSDITKFEGVAPSSRIVNVKVGAADGSVDVSQVIAGINWVTEHRNDNGMNIRVLNLSFGTQSVQPWQVDPLSYAVDVAWQKGIVVVVSAGNDGLDVGQPLADPANNPHVLAVGAVDTQGTTKDDDDTVPSFASHGRADRTVDLVAPGSHVLGLRVPGSYIDENYPGGTVNDRFQRGSGTSEAAAVTSGAAALLLSRFPTATPDAIKNLLTDRARGMKTGLFKQAMANLAATAYPGIKPDQALKLLLQQGSDGVTKVNVNDLLSDLYSGNGRLDLHSVPGDLPKPKSAKGSQDDNSTTGGVAVGTGSLELARGGVHLMAADGTPLTGEIDIFGQAWNGSRWSSETFAGSTWTGGLWNGSRWSGDGWTGSRWSGSRWSGSDWTGSRWSGSRWSGSRWSGSRWSGSRWSGSRWSGDDWSGSRWSGSLWS